MRLEYQPHGDTAAVVIPLELVDAAVASTIVHGTPVRQPVFYRGQYSKPGWYWMASVNRLVSYESKFERDFLIAADYHGNTIDVLPQPLRLHFERPDRPRQHIPDYMIALNDGTHGLIDVKGAHARNKPINQITFTLTGRACDALDWSFTVFTEPDPTVIANLRYLAGYRNRRYHTLDTHVPVLADLADQNPDGLPAHQMINSLADSTDLPTGVAAATLWRGVWLHIVDAPLDTPLHADTVITPAEQDRTGILPGGAW